MVYADTQTDQYQLPSRSPLKSMGKTQIGKTRYITGTTRYIRVKRMTMNKEHGTVWDTSKIIYIYTQRITIWIHGIYYECNTHRNVDGKVHRLFSGIKRQKKKGNTLRCQRTYLWKSWHNNHCCSVSYVRPYGALFFLHSVHPSRSSFVFLSRWKVYGLFHRRFCVYCIHNKCHVFIQ